VITQTSWMALTRRRGYTLIEMMVVTVLLVLFSSLIVPNYLNMRDSQRRRAFYTGVVDLAGNAREMAISHNATMYLQADSSGNRLVIKQEANDSTYVAADGTSSATTSTSSNQNQDTNPQTNIGTTPNDRSSDPIVTTLPMSPGMQFGNFQLAGTASDASSWKIRFFSDGTSDSGAFELDEKGYVKSLVVNTRGGAVLTDGTIPDTSQESWIAGTYVQRQQ